MNAAAAWTEECLVFDCAGDALPGILTRPATPSPVGLLIVVGGPQYRVGSHRQFVQLARRVAAAGHAVLRFDVRGMGDAEGRLRGFEAVSDDIDAAIAALRAAVPQVTGVALWGLCDGASAALLHADERPGAPLAGLCLLNPWVRSAQTQAAVQVKQYYAKRLLDRAFWRRLLRGEVGWARATVFLGSLRTYLGRRAASARSAPAPDFRQRMARAWQSGRCPLLLVLSGNDLTAREFVEALAVDPAWRGALQRRLLTRVDLAAADHTFSQPGMAAAVEDATIGWLATLAARAPSARPAAALTADVG